ncbi:MAG: acyl-CoA thioesterase [Methylococcales bacterium]
MAKQEKSLTMTVLMTPDMVNFSGKVHGGIILKLLDQVAYVCAAKYAKSYVVTASLDNVFFKQSINVGELVTFYAHINYVGRSSMEVGIKVVAADLLTDAKRHTNSCYFTMVAVDEKGVSVEVPRLEVETETERKLFAAGALRKQRRQEILAQNRDLHVDIGEGEF